MKVYSDENINHQLTETQDENELITIGEASDLTQGPGGWSSEGSIMLFRRKRLGE